MKRIYIFPILLLLAVIQVKATELSCDSTKLPEKYSIIGKVYGECVRQVPPYDVMTIPLVGSNLSISELPKQGWLTDSTGCFRIDNLEKRAYHLKAAYVGFG